MKKACIVQCFIMYFVDSFTFDSLSWPPAGTAPDWLRAAVCFEAVMTKILKSSNRVLH